MTFVYCFSLFLLLFFALVSPSFSRLPPGRCWDEVPENRPTAAMMIAELDKMEKSDFLFSWKETVTPGMLC
jgi:hypothetical protein